MKKENVFITGGAGFIGSNLADYHLSKGDHVWVLDNLHSGLSSNINRLEQNKYFRFNKADIKTWNELADAVKWADRIYHMAANVGNKMALNYPSETLENNIQSTLRLIKTVAKKNKKVRVLIASSSSVYYHSEPFPDGRFHEKSILNVSLDKIYLETYPLSKIISETIGLSYAFEHNIYCIFARLFNCVGIYQRSKYGMVIPTFVRQALQGDPLTIFGTGKQTRSFLDIRDAVNILDRLVTSPESKNQIVNVGNDYEVSILELANMVIKKTKTLSPITYLSYAQAYGNRYQGFIDVMKRRPYLRKMKQLTGYTHKYSLADTLDDVINSFKNRH